MGNDKCLVRDKGKGPCYISGLYPPNPFFTERTEKNTFRWVAYPLNETSLRREFKPF